jgi:hypothetical protein
MISIEEGLPMDDFLFCSSAVAVIGALWTIGLAAVIVQKTPYQARRHSARQALFSTGLRMAFPLAGYLLVFQEEPAD